MSKAKIFCKGGYVKNEHALNILEYAGEKISSQQLFLKDGTVIHYDGEDKIILSDIDSEEIDKVVLTLKDGKQVPLSWDKYNGEVSKKVTSSQIKNIQGDNICENEARKMQDMDIDEYLKYVANREGVIKDDGYGLFGLNGNVDIAKARKMIMEDYPKSIKWSYIMSLRPEDAYVEGYDNRKAWQDLVCSVAPQIAKAYNISFENLVINAAYHDDKDHKHIHMIFYSKDYTEGFVRGGNESLIKATRKLKSVFLNNIFEDEVADIKDLVNTNRKNLKQSLLVSLSKQEVVDEKLISMFQNVAEKFDSHTGRMDYGYLSPELKSNVNHLLSYMIKNTAELSELFESLCDSQKQYIEMYNQDEEKIKNQLNIFKASLLSPKKGQADLQNTIVHYLDKYNDEKVTSLPLENLPATKEKKVEDSLPFESPNASENMEIRQQENTMSDYSDNDYSSFDDLDDTTEKSQATKGKKDNIFYPRENFSSSFDYYFNEKEFERKLIYVSKSVINKAILKKLLNQDKGKELLSPIYKTISEEIYGKIVSNENNQVKDKLKNISKISKQLEEAETQEEKEKLISLTNQSVLAIINNINLDTTNLKIYLQEEIKKSVPKDIQNDVLEQLDKSFEKDVLNFPYGYMIFAMGQDYDLTTSKAIAESMRSDIKSFQSMIYKDIYEVLGQRTSKCLNNPIFKAMISYNQNIALELASNQEKKPGDFKQSDIDIMSVFAALMEKPEYKDLYDKIYKNFSCELRKHCSCDDEQVEKMFQKAILEDDYKGINSSIKFMCDNSQDIIKKINRQQAIAVLYILGNTIARNLYDQNRDMQNHLGKINSLNKGKNRFIEKSKRSTFEKTILNNYMI